MTSFPKNVCAKLTLAFLFLLAGEAYAQFSGWNGRGEVVLEARQFRDDNNPATVDSNVALFSRLETSYESEDAFRFMARGFGRVDNDQVGRDRLTIEDLYVSKYFGEDQNWRILAGKTVFNWTATEAFHPVDVINSRNYDSNLENLEKIGETVIALEDRIGEGWLSLYFFPYFEEPEYPGNESRLGIGVDIEKARWVDGQSSYDDQWGLQWGARFTQLLWGADISLHFLRRMDRQFPLVGTHDPAKLSFLGTPTEFHPYYFRMTQYGTTVQWPWEALLFKLEAAKRHFEEDLPVYTVRGARTAVDHSEVAIGFEYGLVHDSGAESFLFLEATSIFGVDEQTRAELSAFQRDAMVGIRHARNDIDGTEYFLSVIGDLERSREYLFNASWSRRLGDLWRLMLGARFYDAPVKGILPTGLETLHEDHYGYAQLARFF